MSLNKLVAINPIKPGYYTVDGRHEVYLASDVDFELARLRDESQRSLSLANQCADERDKAIDEIVGLRHDVELLRRAVEWLKSQAELYRVEVPAEFADIIKPKEST